jgi:hypothetical protein
VRPPFERNIRSHSLHAKRCASRRSDIVVTSNGEVGWSSLPSGCECSMALHGNQKYGINQKKKTQILTHTLYFNITTTIQPVACPPLQTPCLSLQTVHIQQGNSGNGSQKILHQEHRTSLGHDGPPLRYVRKRRRRKLRRKRPHSRPRPLRHGWRGSRTPCVGNRLRLTHRQN